MSFQVFNFVDCFEDSQPMLKEGRALHDWAFESENFFNTIQNYKQHTRRINHFQVHVLQWLHEKGYLNADTLITQQPTSFAEEKPSEHAEALDEVIIINKRRFYTELYFRFRIGDVKGNFNVIDMNIGHNFIEMEYQDNKHTRMVYSFSATEVKQIISGVVADLIRRICDDLSLVSYCIKPYNPVKLETVYTCKNFSFLKGEGKYYVTSVYNSSVDAPHEFQLDELQEVGRYIATRWTLLEGSEINSAILIDLENGQAHETLYAYASVNSPITDSQGRTWELTDQDYTFKMIEE